MIQILCGSIDSTDWPQVQELELYKDIQLSTNFTRRVYDRLYPYIMNNDALDIIDKLMAYCPEKRIDADSVLNHDFFWFL